MNLLPILKKTGWSSGNMNQDMVFTVVYYDGEQKYYYIKRFQAEATEKPVQVF